MIPLKLTTSDVLGLKSRGITVRSKYRAKRIERGGQKFDSLAEYRRYLQLVNLELAGYILDLKRQVSFELARGVRYSDAKRATPPLRYVADFTYFDVAAGRFTVEDVKGMRLPLYKAKRHLMLALHGIEVREVQA